MCGIVGVIGDLEANVVSNMVEELKHRGPDNVSTVQIGNVHLGHARLSIIDISEKSNQPLWDADNKACIVFNGEIYNYKELRDSLLAEGVNFNSEGDAEVLLNLYLKFGVDSLRKLSGIFSFAIWCTAQNQLLLARDNYGVKPLYYHQGSSFFSFASEIKSLLHVPDVERSLNLDTLFRSLVFLWNPGEETLFKDIKKIKPGHYMTVKNGVIQEYKKYWSWPSYDPDPTCSEKMHSEKVLSVLREAVNEQLVADVKVGSFLSGGLDSSLIVALASEELKGNIDGFTIDTGGEAQNQEGFSDDLPYAKKVADFLDIDLDVLKVSPNVVTLLPKMIYHLDELQADPAPLNVMLICEQAKRKGIKVLLSGAGGDDIFTGYRRHFAVTVERYWSWLPKPLRSLFKDITSNLPMNNWKLRRLTKAFKYADLDGDQRLLSYFYWMDPEIARRLFKNSDDICDNPFQFILDELKTLGTDDPVEKLLTLEQKYFLVDHNFNYTDKMSMASGVEVRVPFLDQRVVSTAAKIPSKLKQKGKIGKSILKRAAESVLPKNIVYRSKSGFGAPLRTWLKSDLAAFIDSNLSSDQIEKRGIFKVEAVQKLIQDDRSGKEDYSYPIFGLLCFEIWCQIFLDEKREGV
jgi:asparagine synthase (glutamine-hydrolysing)